MEKIPVDALIGFAQQIIDGDPKITIPLEILNVTKDTIDGRRACAGWYSGFERDQELPRDVIDSNTKHRYFLLQLETVFEARRREVKSRRPKRKKKIELSGAEHLTNLYQHLQLEEPSSSESSNPSSSSTKPKKPVVEEHDYSLADSEEDDKAFAVYCMFQDLWELRMQIGQLWHDYHTGKISFIAASHTTESAIQIAFLLAGDFHSTHSDLQNFDQIVDYLGHESYISVARYCGGGQVEAGSSDPASASALEHKDSFLLMPAWCAINDVRQLALDLHIQRSSVQASRPTTVFPGHRFLLNIVGDLGKLAGLPCQEYTEEFRTQLDGPWLMPYCDHYTARLFGLVSAPTPFGAGIPAATAMYMNVYDVLEGDLERGLRECMPNARATPRPAERIQLLV